MALMSTLKAKALTYFDTVCHIVSIIFAARKASIWNGSNEEKNAGESLWSYRLRRKFIHA